MTRFEAWARRADGGGLGIGTAKDYRGYVAKLRVITEAEFAALPEAERSDTRSGYRCYKRYVAAHPEDWLSGWDDPGLRPDDWADP